MNEFQASNGIMFRESEDRWFPRIEWFSREVSRWIGVGEPEDGGEPGGFTFDSRLCFALREYLYWRGEAL